MNRGMSSDIVLQPIAKQVNPIGLNGSGSTTQMGKDLEKQNQQLTMQIAQASADEVYDATVPQRTESAQFVHESFGNMGPSPSLAYSIGVVGILFIVYGLVVD